MAVVDFCFDYLSPYAYLASREIEPLCARHDAELRLRPVVFAGLLSAWGQLGPAEIPPKGRHAFRDCLRYALRRGVPLRSPRHHPFRPLTALRVSLREVSGADQARVVHTLFSFGWADGGDLGDDAEITAALDAAGLEGERLVARTHEPGVKEALRQETQHAVSRGVFGIPTTLIGEELFWGLDQLPNVDDFLAGSDPLAGLDWTERATTDGPSAWRRGVPRREG